MNQFLIATGLVLGTSISMAANAQIPTANSRNSSVFDSVKALTYADVGDMVVAAQIVVHVRIRSTQKVAVAKGFSPISGRRRLLVTGDVMTLIRGEGGIPPRITWLVDQAPDARGKFPKLNRQEMMLAGYRVAGFPTEIQLVSPDAQMPMTAGAGQRARVIAAEAARTDAVPEITGVSEAFHTPGPVAGEGETQIFLSTASGRPVSLSVNRTPGGPARWTVSLSEAVGDGTPPPPRDTFLWYRLACGLPAKLPAEATAANAEQATTIGADYDLVRRELGACTRTIKPPPRRTAA